MVKVAIQGIAGSFHDIAAQCYFGQENIELVPCNTFKDLFSCLTENASMVGIVAIENTIAGSLLPNYNLLKDSRLTIIGEHKLRIKHNLVAMMKNYGNQLKIDIAKNILIQQATLDEFIKGLIECDKKGLINTKVVWNLSAFVNIISLDLKIITRDLALAEDDWSQRHYIRQAYLLIYEFYKTYNSEQDFYILINEKLDISELNTEKQLVIKLLRDYKKKYEKTFLTIRKNTIGHRSHGGENSYSFIGLRAAAKFIVENGAISEYYPNGEIIRKEIDNDYPLPEHLNTFVKSFEIKENNNRLPFNGFFGFTAYDAVRYFEKVDIVPDKNEAQVPDMKNRNSSTSPPTSIL